MLSPDDRIRVIEGSLRCFSFGWPGLLPLVGVPFVILATLAYWRSTTPRGERWNPARRYRQVGNLLTCLGAFVQLVAVGCVGWVTLTNFLGY